MSACTRLRSRAPGLSRQGRAQAGRLPRCLTNLGSGRLRVNLRSNRESGLVGLARALALGPLSGLLQKTPGRAGGSGSRRMDREAMRQIKERKSPGCGIAKFLHLGRASRALSIPSAPIWSLALGPLPLERVRAVKPGPSTGGFRPQASWRFRGSNASLALGFWPQLYAAALPPDGALQDGLPAIEPCVSASNLSRLCCPWLELPADEWDRQAFGTATVRLD